MLLPFFVWADAQDTRYLYHLLLVVLNKPGFYPRCFSYGARVKMTDNLLYNQQMSMNVLKKLITAM